ncbi:MAG: hypothetical protein HFF05_00990 [Oscillospiraceae bacterium]|nr:hypothetical protein [Oscillospiraceae bacterium]
MDKNAKQIKAAKAKEEEATINRILCWVVGGSVLEFLLMLLNRYWSHYTAAQIDFRVALGTAVKILAVAALACAAGALFWWNNAWKSGKGMYVPGTLCLFMTGVSVSCFAAWGFSGQGLMLMCYVVPAVVILAIIYNLYQREFFLVACQSALSLMGIWLCEKGTGGAYAPVCYAYVVVSTLLLLLAAGLCRKAQGNEGKVDVKGTKYRVFSKDANYGILYAGAVVALLVLVVAAIGITPVILYAVTVTWLLVMAVYYTVKLM